MEIYNDFSTSVEKALSEIDSNWKTYPGLIICGTHTPKDWEQQIELIKNARESGLPFLGICFGHQLAAIENVRNVMGDVTASSEELEYDMGQNFVVKKRKDGLKVGLHDGESYWNNYEVDEQFLQIWKKTPNIFTCQFHPEYQSSKDNPHTLLVEFLNYAKEHSVAMQSST